MKRYRYRAYPTPGQEQSLARTFGCARVVFNDVIAARRAQHELGLPFENASALYAAQDPSVRTPAVIPLPGDHWRGRSLGDGAPIHYPRCPEPGHTSYRADNCGACRAEQLEATAPRDTRPGGVPMPDAVRALIERRKP